MPKILISSIFTDLTGGVGEIQVAGLTPISALEELGVGYPELRKRLYDAAGRLRSFVSVYVNDMDVRALHKMDASLQESDEVVVVPSYTGGLPAAERPDPLPDLRREETLRYSRHLVLPEVGVTGQRRLKAASVLCIGTGGLGSPLALYLSAAGIGRLGLVDFDVVDFSNLHRQVIHFTNDVGKPKLQSASEKIAQLNPNVHVDMHEARLTSANAMEIMGSYDVIVDGTDNFPTRYLVNDACVLLGKPNVYGSIFRFEGMASVFDARVGPCYRCLYPEPPPPGLVPSCAEGGVLGILPGLIGLVQATETIKLILGEGDPLSGRLLMFDALKMRFREIKLGKDPDCPICGDHPTISELIDYDQFCGIQTHQDEELGPEWQITPREVKQRLDLGENLQVIDVRTPEEYEIAHISGARLIPLSELPDRVAELPRDEDIVLHCKSGARSARALSLLREQGFTRVKNMTGGIAAWSDEVDPDVPKY